jgi:hypothetical protein
MKLIHRFKYLLTHAVAKIGKERYEVDSNAPDLYQAELFGVFFDRSLHVSYIYVYFMYSIYRNYEASNRAAPPRGDLRKLWRSTTEVRRRLSYCSDIMYSRWFLYSYFITSIGTYSRELLRRGTIDSFYQ